MCRCRCASRWAGTPAPGFLRGSGGVAVGALDSLLGGLGVGLRSSGLGLGLDADGLAQVLAGTLDGPVYIVTLALFFLLALFFAPLAGMVPAYASAAALLYVACVMARGLADMAWDDVTEYAPAVITAIAMPLTYSIATGIGLGFITYAVLKLCTGKVKEVHWIMWVIAALFLFKFIYIGGH